MTGQIPVRIAHCNKCKCVFEWLPKQFNSTKGEDVYPRCPDCGTFRETCDNGILNRPDDTEVGVW